MSLNFSSSNYKALILDRDGVINADSPDYIKSPDEWTPIPGSLEAIARVKALGIPIAVITNQSGVGRGYYDLRTLAAIHDKMHTQLAMAGTRIDSLLFCPHHPDDQCVCRKPKPTMLKAACLDLGVAVSDALYIGDKESDFKTALAAGCHFAFVATGYGNSVVKQIYQAPIFSDLFEAIKGCFSPTH